MQLLTKARYDNGVNERERSSLQLAREGRMLQAVIKAKRSGNISAKTLKGQGCSGTSALWFDGKQKKFNEKH